MEDNTPNLLIRGKITFFKLKAINLTFVEECRKADNFKNVNLKLQKIKRLYNMVETKLKKIITSHIKCS